MKIQYNEADQLLTCIFEGRLDTLATAAISEALNGKLAEMAGAGDGDMKFGGNIVFDFAGVNYIASSFIRICVSTAKVVNKGAFSIVNCDPVLKKTFKIAGLDELLNVS